MPEPSRLREREFLPPANQALAELEAATGKPVVVLEAPELGVLATIRRAGAQDASHLLRIKGGESRLVDYLIVFQCRMALRDGAGRRWVVREQPTVHAQLSRDCEQLHHQLPPGKAQELGKIVYDGLILQLRSMGPGMVVDRWIREQCADLREAQAEAISAQITGNLAGLKASTRANVPAAAGEASLAMNAAYAIFGGDLLGKPYLAVPYLSQGYGEIGRRLIHLALAEDSSSAEAAQEGADRRIIDAWAQALGLVDWYEWGELPE
jgi:hypothetical protein